MSCNIGHPTWVTFGFSDERRLALRFSPTRMISRAAEQRSNDKSYEIHPKGSP